jgi:putative Mg2+ transporter-C (MgtC) family protein
MNNTTNNITNEDYVNYITFSFRYIITALLKLGLSLIFSLILSIERELHSHPGGMRTHTLVGIGSCLFTMISVNLKDKYDVKTADPARICAQIVSGMGFLGSATIFKSNNYVKGINTAASLWISAAISMAIGADLWELGIVASFFTLLILLLNNRYKRFRYGKKKKDDNLKEVQMEEGLSYDADDAPYGHENTDSD